MARLIIRGFVCTVLLLSVASWAVADDAVYVEGTVTAIPAKTSGTLDLSGADALYFRYGGTSFELPFDKITRFHLGRESDGVGSQIAGGAAKVGKTVLPMFFSKKKHLTIQFQTQGATNTDWLVFQLAGDEAKAALPVLEARTKEAAPVTAAAETAHSEATRIAGTVGTWWGDALWRTERNREYWPARPNEQTASSQPAEPAVEIAASQDDDEE